MHLIGRRVFKRYGHPTDFWQKIVGFCETQEIRQTDTGQMTWTASRLGGHFTQRRARQPTGWSEVDWSFFNCLQLGKANDTYWCNELHQLLRFNRVTELRWISVTDQIGEGKKSNSPGDDWTDERIVPDTKIAISSPGDCLLQIWTIGLQWMITNDIYLHS